MSRWDVLQSEITDIEFQLKEDHIKVIPVLKDKKNPKGKDYYNKEFPLKKLRKHNGNYGIAVGYNHEINNKSLAVIDIDGYSKENNNYKKKTQELIFEALKEHLPVTPMMVQTQSGGYHIYLWNETIVDNIHETSKCLHFPDDFEIEELRGKSLWKSIEIFTKWKSKQCVLPTSTIKKNKYSIINDIHSFSSMGTVNNIHTIVKNALLKAGYTYHEDNISDNKYESQPKTITLRDLTKNEIEEITDVLKPYFQHELLGDKHNSVLALGGYLSRYITEKSAVQLTRLLMRKTDNKANETTHVTTMRNNYKRNIKNKTGLPSLLDNIKWHYPDANLKKLTFEIRKLIDPTYHYSFPIRQYSKKKIKYLDIDYHNQEIRTFTRHEVDESKDKKQKDTKESVKKTREKHYYYTDEYVILNLEPKRFYEAYNILDKQAKPTFCFKYYRKGMPYAQTLKGNSIANIEKQLKEIPGVVLKPREAQGILNEIISEYIELDQLETVTEVPVAGIFINPLTGELVRSDKDGQIPITKPSQKKVRESLKILNLLRNVYAPCGGKRDATKLSHILRHGMLMPFSYILKIKYEWRPILILYGKSQTAKTTLAEISMCFWTVIDDEISVGGSSVDTPYRMGNAISRQGYGVIINEPGSILETNKDLFDLIKRAVESQWCREKMESGVHIKVPAYSNMIITSNIFVPKNDAFIRRSQRLDFYISERLSEEDRELFKETFHHNNWRDTDFLKLHHLGDFICWYVSENLDVLSLKHDEIVDKFLDAAIEYAGLDKKDYQWLYESAEVVDSMSSSDEYIVEKFRIMVMNDYNKNHNKIKPHEMDQIYARMEPVKPPTQNGVDDEEVSQDTLKFINNESLFKHTFCWMVEHEWIPYLIIDNKEQVGIRSNVSEYLLKYDVQITADGLAELLGTEHKSTSYHKKHMRLSKLPYDEFREVLR